MGKGKKEHSLPAMLYVYEERDGDETYFIACKDVKDTASTDGPRLVGRYFLGAVQKVELRVRKTKVPK